MRSAAFSYSRRLVKWLAVGIAVGASLRRCLRGLYFTKDSEPDRWPPSLAATGSLAHIRSLVRKGDRYELRFDPAWFRAVRRRTRLPPRTASRAGRARAQRQLRRRRERPPAEVPRRAERARHGSHTTWHPASSTLISVSELARSSDGKAAPNSSSRSRAACGSATGSTPSAHSTSSTGPRRR